MGKKARKTRWRRLPIGGSEEDGGISLEPSEQKSTEEQRITFNEDEYTKITTPRQDVLFKKGYFGRKRVTNTTDVQEVHSTDSVESESYVNEEPQYVYAAPAGYVDPTGAVYYVNGNTYETYDPYTGTITVVVGPPPQYPPGNHPVLAAIPCQPVPLQPIEWFNPPTPWCYSYSKRKRYSTDSQNCSAQSSESTGPPGSPQESVEECAGPVFPPPQYVYPGYMFGAPMYNMNGVTVQGVIPQNQVPPIDLTASKRRKKRRRRRRGGVTDEGSESSCEEALSCEVNGSQSEASSDANGSHSGASSDAGQGSSCSKTNSDSGINTDPTPNSGSNSPPINECQNHSDISHLDAVYDQHTSLPILGEETNCSSCNDDTTIISEDSIESGTKSFVSLKGDSVTPDAQKHHIHTEDKLLFETIDTVENEVTQPITVTKSLPTNLSPETNISAVSNDIESLSTEICKSQNESYIESCVEKSQDLSESEVQGIFVNECIESSAEENDLVIETESTEKLHSTQLHMQNISNATCESLEVNTDKTNIIGTEQENVAIQLNLQKEEKEVESNISNLPKIEIIDVVDFSLDYKILTGEKEPSLPKEENIISANINKFEENNKKLTPELNCSRFPTCHDVGTPIPPPRRKKITMSSS
uniref:Uncharacterized protein n=1 Tax=Clastoptera arizonana TaxID=38151 RepID=A0A1B6DFV7_9HEMI